MADNPSAIIAATYNVRCANCSKHPVKREKRWGTRAQVIAEAIRYEGIDVIGLQEVSSGVLSSGGISQFEDLVDQLGGTYAATNTARYNCVRA